MTNTKPHFVVKPICKTDRHLVRFAICANIIGIMFLIAGILVIAFKCANTQFIMLSCGFDASFCLTALIIFAGHQSDKRKEAQNE